MATSLQQPQVIIKPEWKSIPPLGCTDEEAKTYIARVVNEKSRLRRWNLLRIARNLNFYRGRQWIDAPRELTGDGASGYKFKDVERPSNSVFPMPVDNLIAPGVDNEVSRLVRKEYIPNTHADDQKPDLEAAARLAKDLLLHDIREQRWADIRTASAFDLTVGGTSTVRSIWDETQTDMVPVAAQDAVQCPSCQEKFASAKIPMAQARAGIPGGPGSLPVPLTHTDEEALAPVDGDPNSLEMKVCPLCVNSRVPLEPYNPSVEDIEGEGDIFNRPMGELVPRGAGIMEMVPQFEYFPENGGVNVEPATVKVHGQKTPRELEWLASRCPDYAHLFKAEPASELMKCHPIVGDTAFGTNVGDSEVFDHHAALIEVYVDPIPLPGLEEGRRFWQVGKHLPKNDGLIVEVDAPDGKMRKVKRAVYSSARFKRTPGQFWGGTPVDDAVPLNRLRNEVMAQGQDIREHGVPWMAVPPGVEIHDSEADTGSMRVVEVESINPGWTPKDSIVNAVPLTGTAYESELDRLKQAIEEKIGPQQIEIGVNQPNVTSGEHAQILAEEASQKRGPRERDLVNQAEAIWTHHLEVTWAFRKEQGEMEVERAAGQFERKSYLGTDLLGQTRVKIDAQSNFDKTLYQSQAAEKAVSAGLYGDLSQDDLLRESLLEEMRLPKLREERSIQIKRAEQVWSEFLRDAKIPVVDETIVDMWLWNQVLGKRWQSDEAVEIQAQADWGAVIEALAGWERKLAEAEALDVQQRAIYEGYPPEQWQQIQQKGTELAMGAAMPGTPPQIPPQPPQSGEFLPESMPKRLLMVWESMLAMPTSASMSESAATGLPPQMSPHPSSDSAVKKLLQFYAVIQQCRIGAERKKAAAMGGAPVVAAPGGGRTVGGMEPTNAGGVVPAPGGAGPVGGA
jgi:hypothetical protein